MRKLCVLLMIASVMVAFAPLAYAHGFKEVFSPLANWYLVVFNSFGYSDNDPPPVLDYDIGVPPPSLNVNGNGWCGNGAYSRKTFDYKKGLVIEWDMFVGPGPSGWNWGRGGLSYNLPNLSNPRPDGVFIDNERCDSHFLAWIELISSNFNPTPFLVVGIVKKDGTGEVSAVIPDAKDLLNAWNRYAITIRPDGHVEFYLDGALLYATSGRIDRSLGKLPVLFGDRSDPGPVRIDNVNVYHQKEDDDKDGHKEYHHYKHRN